MYEQNEKSDKEIEAIKKKKKNRDLSSEEYSE